MFNECTSTDKTNEGFRADCQKRFGCSYPIDGEIIFKSPGRLVQIIMSKEGNNYVSVTDKPIPKVIHTLSLFINYPNPFNPSIFISKFLTPFLFLL